MFQFTKLETYEHMSHFKNATIFICHEMKRWLISFSWLFHLFLYFRRKFWVPRKGTHIFPVLRARKWVNFSKSVTLISEHFFGSIIRIPTEIGWPLIVHRMHEYISSYQTIDLWLVDHGHENDSDWPGRKHLLKHVRSWLFINMFVRASFWTRTFQWNLVMPDYGRLRHGIT